MLQPVLHFIEGRIAFYNSNTNIKGKRRGDITSTIKEYREHVEYFRRRFTKTSFRFAMMKLLGFFVYNLIKFLLK